MIAERDAARNASASQAGGVATTGPAEPRPTHRWRGVVGIALLAAAVGLLSTRPSVLLLAGLGTVFAAYPWIAPVPEPTVTVDRRVSESRPIPGDPVEVTVTVRNDGDGTLYDLRVVDGVPPGLAVVEGSPRAGCLLRPGETTTFSYALEPTVGCHRFGPVTVIARDLSGSREITMTATIEMDIRCHKPARRPALRADALRHLGQLTGDSGGSGLEFYALREYLPGDPARHIAWAQYARTGEPATVDFLREQRTRVMLVIDAREAAYRSRPGHAHAVQLSVEAADLISTTLQDAKNPVGVGTIGRRVSWLAPRLGSKHRVDLRRVLTTDPALAPTPPETETDIDSQFRQLCIRLQDASQVLFLSPLVDDAAVAFVCKLDSIGVPVSVVSPDVTDRETAGQRLAGIERRNRLKRIRTDGIPVLDWDPRQSLPKTLARKRRVVV